MASQTDKKEEFRKYLDKGNVLSMLTTVLTDLFEMEPKPEDPALYLYQKFGHALNKTPAVTTELNHTEPAPKDLEMKDVPPAVVAEPVKPVDPLPTPPEPIEPASGPAINTATANEPDPIMQPPTQAQPVPVPVPPPAASAAAAAASAAPSAPVPSASSVPAASQ